jgi:hypothetical protein
MHICISQTAGARKSARKGIIPCFGMIVFAIVGVVFFGAGVGVGYLVWSHTSSPSQGSVCSQQTLKDEIWFVWLFVDNMHKAIKVFQYCCYKYTVQLPVYTYIWIF